MHSISLAAYMHASSFNRSTAHSFPFCRLNLMMWRRKRCRSEFDEESKQQQQHQWQQRGEEKNTHTILSHLIIYLNSWKNPITNRAYSTKHEMYKQTVRGGQRFRWMRARCCFFFSHFLNHIPLNAHHLLNELYTFNMKLVFVLVYCHSLSHFCSCQPLLFLPVSFNVPCHIIFRRPCVHIWNHPCF